MSLRLAIQTETPQCKVLSLLRVIHCQQHEQSCLSLAQGVSLMSDIVQLNNFVFEIPPEVTRKIFIYRDTTLRNMVEIKLFLP
jgi:hypothetical protein